MFSSRVKSCVLLPALVLAVILLSYGEAKAHEQEVDFGAIKVIYKDQEQLQKFSELIQPGAFGQSFGSLFGGGGGGSGSKNDVGQYLNNLLRRVQLVLDMPYPRMKIIIKVFDNQQELGQAAAALIGRRLSEPGFYWHATKTIHVTMDDLSVGIMAHEMGHAVIDHFLAIKPPPKIAEMLCQYVDKEITEGRY